MPLPQVNAIWIGKRLGLIHAACLRSFVKSGHDVRLYCYEDVLDVPAGVHVMDAEVLMARGSLLQYPNGSYAISANLMRYRMMALGVGLYVDCDMFCLEPVDDADYILGFQSNNEVNNAVLKLPASSPVVADLIAIREGWLPPWFKEADRKPLVEYAWGSTGPRALTHILRAHKMAGLARPIDVFYPVHFHQSTLLSDPALKLGDLTTPRTRYVHLYGDSGIRYATDSPPRGSPLWQLLELSET